MKTETTFVIHVETNEQEHALKGLCKSVKNEIRSKEGCL
jgi:hypothetical protein